MNDETQEIQAYFTDVEFDFDELDNCVCRAYLKNKHDGKTYEYIDFSEPSPKEFMEYISEMLDQPLLLHVSNDTFINGVEWLV